MAALPRERRALGAFDKRISGLSAWCEQENRLDMIIGQAFARTKNGILALMVAVLAFGAALSAPQAVFAQETAEAVAEATDSASAYTPMAPTPDKGMPTDPTGDSEGAMLKSMTFQHQYTADGEFALWMHDHMLLPIITVISLFVLALLLYVVVRFRRGANPVPSKTTHHTWLEVVWTVVPALILVVIAVPSLSLLARQFESPPEDAITIKAVGYQWYWGYEYPDHDVEVISNMLDADAAAERGEPRQLAVDNRMVVPVGVPLRIQVTAADVIHAFAVPSLWFKQDAVPGRLNERMLIIEEPGVYYGQCSELCGVRHGYMPIAVEALPMEEFEAWIVENGGTLPGAAEIAESDAADEAAEAPEA